MASTGDSDLLNLKISIDADELSDMEEDVPVEEDTEKPEGSSGDGPEAPHVEIKRSLEGRVLPNLGERKYENKAGDFITGIDITDPEFLEKRQQRAKRFGVTPPAEEEAFAKRLELLREELKEASEAEWGIRPEALHVEGVDDLNTQQVFDYFKQFAPGSIEWINDTSCNVVWLDPNTAARAILYYTDSSKIEETTSKKDASTEEIKKEEVPKAEEKMEESSVVTEEEDDDELNLMSDDELEEGETRGKETQTKSTEEDKTEVVKVKTEDEPMEEQTTGSPKGSEVDIPAKFNLTEAKPAIPCERARRLFIRYATNDDKKARGAQRKSKFYMKYGNPNFGGMKGIISESWRRRYKEKKRKAIISQYRKQRSGGKYNDPDGGDGGEEEEEVEEPENDWETELELYRQEQERRLLKEALQTQEKQRPSRPPQKKQKVSNIQAYPGSESEPGSESGSDSDGIDLEYELQQLTKQESKRPARTMYADEVEQRIKQLRHSVKGGSQLAVRVPSSGGVKSRLGIKPDSENKPRLTYTISNVRDRLGGKQQQQQPSQGGANVLQRLGKAASRGESILHRLGQKRPASDSESEEEEEDDDDEEDEEEFDRDEGRDSPELARDLRKRLRGKRTGGKFDFKNLPSLSIEVTRDDSD